MSRKTVNISITPELHSFVERRIEMGGYGTTSEYFRELIRLDQRRELEEFEEAGRHRAMPAGYRQLQYGRRNY